MVKTKEGILIVVRKCLNLENDTIYVPKEVILDFEHGNIIEVYCVLFLLDGEFFPQRVSIKEIHERISGRRVRSMNKSQITRYADTILQLERLGYITLDGFNPKSLANVFTYQFTSNLCGDNFRYGKITTDEYRALYGSRDKLRNYGVSMEVILHVLLYLEMHLFDGRKELALPMVQGGYLYENTLAAKLGFSTVTISHVISYIEDCGIFEVAHAKFKKNIMKKGCTLFVNKLRTNNAKGVMKETKRLFSNMNGIENSDLEEYNTDVESA